MKVLLTEGSGLTSRQVAGLLAAAGHEVGVLSSEPIALGRFTRAVRRWHGAPPFGRDPFGWLETALAVHRRHRYDLLFPTQEQVTVLSASLSRLRAEGVATVVPPFDAVAAVQDKISASTTLDRLGIPQPPTTTIHSVDELGAWDRFPAFAKVPIGTASSGVRRLGSPADLGAATVDPVVVAALEGDGLVVQEAAEGPLAMVQSVFERGRLVAFHANLRTREGVRGGASHKRSVDLPEARAALDRLGGALEWNGGLSADVVVTEAGPLVIDVNPRLVEPGNAHRSGVDLVGAMLAVAAGGAPDAPAGRPGVATHQLLLAVLKAAEGAGGRRAVVRELADAARGAGEYRSSHEELTPLHRDPRAALPVVAAASATLAAPSTWSWFASGSVESYAITPAGWAEVVRRAR